MEKRKKKSISMTEGNIVKSLLLFSIPLILGNLLQQTYNTVDSIIVGNYVGSSALAAVGSSTALINLLIGFSQGISVGAGVIVSHSIGAKDNKKIELSVHTAMMLSILFGTFLSIVGFIFTPQLLEWMKTPIEVMPESITYLRLFFLGTVFNIVYNMEAGILNAVGNSKRSLLYLGVASVTNIILDIIFVKILGMGVSGVAIATNISQFISCILALRFLVKVSDNYFDYNSTFIITTDKTDHIIPKGTYLTFTFKGSYENVIDHYKNLKNFITNNNLTVIGDIIEIYHIEIHITDNIQEYITEIQIPVIIS